jgi:hypothetical protein
VGLKRGKEGVNVGNDWVQEPKDERVLWKGRRKIKKVIYWS